MPTPSQVQEAVDGFVTDAALLHSFVHGDAETVVSTEGGPLPSLAKVAAAFETATSDVLSSYRKVEDLADRDGIPAEEISYGSRVYVVSAGRVFEWTQDGVEGADGWVGLLTEAELIGRARSMIPLVSGALPGPDFLADDFGRPVLIPYVEEM